MEGGSLEQHGKRFGLIGFPPQFAPSVPSLPTQVGGKRSCRWPNPAQRVIEERPPAADKATLAASTPQPKKDEVLELSPPAKRSKSVQGVPRSEIIMIDLDDDDDDATADSTHARTSSQSAPKKTPTAAALALMAAVDTRAEKAAASKAAAEKAAAAKAAAQKPAAAPPSAAAGKGACGAGRGKKNADVVAASEAPEKKAKAKKAADGAMAVKKAGVTADMSTWKRPRWEHSKTRCLVPRTWEFFFLPQAFKIPSVCVNPTRAHRSPPTMFFFPKSASTF